ncbi:nucleotidyltransferase family protein [Sandaracinobacter neustonicus]|uniref:Nucleotidyltransferase family protein n=1 Tax=Sandaracinobacter neustonicus TaxID=1715348 RepID=A0A501XPW4_9SPHN|nr:nucleotidyltransferase family protein [Sandaracinobacter neustonicus]TPE62449.1 nucleotidyltransferase family protein [Sandaracinobacter neustonicus]
MTAPQEQVGAIVLAAGQSRRMGSAKLALNVEGVPMLARTLAAVREAGLPLLLVTGGHEATVRAVAGDAPFVRAEAYAQGLAESLKAGLRAAPGDWGAALVVLGDMPFVQAETLRALAQALASGAMAVVPVQGGRRGNPAGFARSVWPQLMVLEGGKGARGLLDALGVVEVAVADAGVHRDLDSPGDLR